MAQQRSASKEIFVGGTNGISKRGECRLEHPHTAVSQGVSLLISAVSADIVNTSSRLVWFLQSA